MSSSSDGSGFAVPGLVVVLALVGIFYVQTGPLQTQRPPNPNVADQAFSDQKAPARLWQDPFEAAERHLKAQAASAPAATVLPRDRGPQVGVAAGGVPILGTDWLATATLGWGRAALDRLDVVPGAGHTDAPTPQPCPVADKTQVLAAMVDAGPYAESAESRLRARYAILSALDVSGYQPVDSTHIGYLQPPGEDGQPKLVPYERFERKNAQGTSENLLLLWLDGAAFKKAPISRIRSVIGVISPPVLRQECIADDVIKIIGPASSDGLAALLKEPQPTANGTNEQPTGALRRLEFYSATATATDMSMIAAVFGADATHEGTASVQARIQGTGLGVAFHRLIPDDEQLAKRLGGELAERGLFSPAKQNSPFKLLTQGNDEIKRILCSAVQGGPGRDNLNCRHEKGKHIVLIAEWDTTYGRSLPVAVTNELLRRKGDQHAGTLKTLEQLQDHCRRQDHGPQAAGPHPDPCWLHYFSYMRGLDGNIPAGKDRPDDSRSTSPSVADRSGAQARAMPASERAEGQAQLDYLRRLTKELTTLKNADGTPARIFAIGILGSDLHDKMLILQALRPAFRSPPLFFTTDLDARMFDAAYATWTHGLIVASGFGLNPAEHDPDATPPPFRGSYQTAIYHAVRLAVPSAGAAPELSAAQCVERDPKVLVKLYEIGRNGPYEYVRTRLAQECKGLASGAGGNSHPQRYARLEFIDATLAAGFFVLTLAGVVVLYRPDLRDVLRARPLRALAVAALGLALIAMALYLLYQSRLGCPLRDDPSCLEPFSLTSGISGWMPIYLTTLALALSLLFLPWLLIKRCRVIGEIELRYIVGSVGAIRHAGSSSRAIRQTLATEPEQGSATPLYEAMWQGIARLLRTVVCRPAPGASADTGRRSDQAQQVWEKHRRGAAIGWHTLVSLGLALLFYYFVINLFAATGGGGGSGALRGDALRGFAANLRIPSTLALSLLVFLYLDVAARARILIADLSRKDLQWPDQVRRHYSIKELKVDRCFVDPFISLRVAARYADMTVRAVAYPLLVLLLLVAARMPWFDTNTPPIGILIAYVVLAFYLLASAWLAQRAARTLRAGILADYQRRLRELDPRSPSGSLHQRQLEDLIGRVEVMDDFAFQRFSDNPLVKAAILPFGSLGLGLLEFLG